MATDFTSATAALVKIGHVGGKIVSLLGIAPQRHGGKRASASREPWLKRHGLWYIRDR
jgi:hypothetical protein